MFRAGLLDVDGVLVDSEELYYQIVREIFLTYEVNIGREEYLERWIIKGTTTPGVIRDYGLDVTPGKVRERKARMAERIMKERLEMMPGAMEMLDALAEYPLGLVTSANADEMRMKIGKFVILDRFLVTVTYEDVTNKKPHPEPYVTGLEEFRRIIPDLDPSEVFVIEDNPSGAQSAKGAGCIAIAYPNGFTADMAFPYADAVVSSLREVTSRMLERLYAETRR